MKIPTNQTKLLCTTIVAILLLIAASATAMADNSCTEWCDEQNGDCVTTADEAYQGCWNQCYFNAFGHWSWCISLPPPFGDMCWNALQDYYSHCAMKDLEWFWGQEMYYEDYTQYLYCDNSHDMDLETCSYELSGCYETCGYCGDETCDPDETCEICPDDCGICE